MNRTKLGRRSTVLVGLALMSIVRVRTEAPVNAIEAVSLSDVGALGNGSSQFVASNVRGWRAD